MPTEFDIDIAYFESALETLEFISQIINYIQSTSQTHTLDQFLAEIMATAESGIKSSLEHRSKLGTKVLTTPQKRSSTTIHWEGVRSMTKFSIKKWSECRDIPKFLLFLESSKSILTEKSGLKVTSEDGPLAGAGASPFSLRLRREEHSSTPFIYYFPYPKGPPSTSAESKLKPKILLQSDDQSPFNQEFIDSPFFREFLNDQGDKKKE